MAAQGQPARPQPLEEVARVAHAKREVLLRAYRHLLRREDLEDCYSQATLELLAYARRGGTFADASHLGNTLELRYLSRIRDLRRALAGRSPMQAALATALSLEGPDGHEAAVADPRASPEALVLVRHDLRLLAHSARALSPDQRLVLAHQLANTSCRAFCQQFGWSPEKYRKVAQRGRARLKRLASTDDPHVPFGD
ncbi:MAG: hypothetical protein E6F96_00480 [Actinobacteria bacterium]|nr:MAG: hypothetical protein E6F96_00480 [Actinomycetota bacterium]